jgi:hypothetical protein
MGLDMKGNASKAVSVCETVQCQLPAQIPISRIASHHHLIPLKICSSIVLDGFASVYTLVK